MINHPDDARPERAIRKHMICGKTTSRPSSALPDFRCTPPASRLVVTTMRITEIVIDVSRGDEIDFIDLLC